MLISISAYSQVYNTQVEAKIELKSKNNLIEITGFAFNKTEIDQSLRYVLSVIKNNPQNSNKSKNRFLYSVYPWGASDLFPTNGKNEGEGIRRKDKIN